MNLSLLTQSDENSQVNLRGCIVKLQEIRLESKYKVWKKLMKCNDKGMRRTRRSNIMRWRRSQTLLKRLQSTEKKRRTKRRAMNEEEKSEVRLRQECEQRKVSGKEVTNIKSGDRLLMRNPLEDEADEGRNKGHPFGGTETVIVRLQATEDETRKL